ncbi:hypothetical protein TREMEDRAFT_62155 [Tremella mesenterica DSM 1558]|uniref:uncharacterized protein n=1 Tax=Tremella mesenterica (strain ATCC 24925 / CBS 8224 / DSM 1558 / NBRC 9311 / NRRL Y-6157 / RJB 2259-6 / UBC 559-6) TaxID=578456 RepID=UPI0003F49F76|nr:uncharacterized protein TREMEDRAFT_62155 [Tremella mesenterica DSM 1558]EIW69291.1 hypothetical protein TREMEDRAFT_62155 [Tremella mesenterica DSM 1558]
METSRERGEDFLCQKSDWMGRETVIDTFPAAEPFRSSRLMLELDQGNTNEEDEAWTSTAPTALTETAGTTGSKSRRRRERVKSVSVLSEEIVIQGGSQITKRLQTSMNERWNSLGSRTQISTRVKKPEYVPYSTYQIQTALVEAVSNYVLEETMKRGTRPETFSSGGAQFKTPLSDLARDPCHSGGVRTHSEQFRDPPILEVIEEHNMILCIQLLPSLAFRILARGVDNNQSYILDNGFQLHVNFTLPPIFEFDAFAHTVIYLWGGTSKGAFSSGVACLRWNLPKERGVNPQYKMSCVFCPTTAITDKTYPTHSAIDFILSGGIKSQLISSAISRWNSFGDRLQARVRRQKPEFVKYASYQMDISLVETLSNYVLEQTQAQGQTFQMVDIKLLDIHDLISIGNQGEGAVLSAFGPDNPPTFSQEVTDMDEGLIRH